MKITVRVPGTSANLGPGFDVLGIALSLYNTFEFEKIPQGIEITGCDPEYANEDNLAVQAWREVEKKIGAVPSGIRLHISADVPVARGLGSSATLLAAGVKAANAAYGNPLSDHELLCILTDMEGHPDNVAPALLGGLRASMMCDGDVLCVEYPVHPNLGFCVLIPDFETMTSQARSVLPKQVEFRDAVFELSRLALTLHALGTADFAALGASMDDRLHQPYRWNLIHEHERARSAAMENGAAAFCISGSGSALLCVVHAAEAEQFACRMEKALSDSRYSWRALPLHVDTQGAKIVG